MSHRPYPNADRARHQLDRHADETGPHAEPRPVTPMERQLAEAAAAVMRAVQPNGITLADRLRAAFQPRPTSSEEKTA
ncbi:hypothetical protein ACWDUC_14165 [Streptomyces tricolor]